MYDEFAPEEFLLDEGEEDLDLSDEEEEEDEDEATEGFEDEEEL